MKKITKAISIVFITLFLFSFIYANEGAISGVVTDSITGNPIPNARVNARRINGHGCGTAVTDENGYYIIQNLAPGLYRVTACAQNYYPKHYPNPVEVIDGQTTTDINFALRPYTPNERGSISGRVTDSITGNPIANVRVNACGPSCGQAITNENGEYIIENLIPGDYRVNATAPNYFPKRYPEMVTVYPNQNTPDINFQLVPRFMPPPRGTGSISGVVLDSLTNQPIANAQVVAMLRLHRRPRIIGRGTTNENGEYLIENLPTGDYIVIARALNYYPKRYPELIHVEDGQNTPNINFLLIPRSQEHRYHNEIENRIRERILRR